MFGAYTGGDLCRHVAAPASAEGTRSGSGGGPGAASFGSKHSSTSPGSSSRGSPATAFAAISQTASAGAEAGAQAQPPSACTAAPSASYIIPGAASSQAYRDASASARSPLTAHLKKAKEGPQRIKATLEAMDDPSRAFSPVHQASNALPLAADSPATTTPSSLSHTTFNLSGTSTLTLPPNLSPNLPPNLPPDLPPPGFPQAFFALGHFPVTSIHTAYAPAQTLGHSPSTDGSPTGSSASASSTPTHATEHPTAANTSGLGNHSNTYTIFPVLTEGNSHSPGPGSAEDDSVDGWAERDRHRELPHALSSVPTYGLISQVSSFSQVTGGVDGVDSHTDHPASQPASKVPSPRSGDHTPSSSPGRYTTQQSNGHERQFTAYNPSHLPYDYEHHRDAGRNVHQLGTASVRANPYRTSSGPTSSGPTSSPLLDQPSSPYGYSGSTPPRPQSHSQHLGPAQLNHYMPNHPTQASAHTAGPGITHVPAPGVDGYVPVHLRSVPPQLTPGMPRHSPPFGSAAPSYGSPVCGDPRTPHGTCSGSSWPSVAPANSTFFTGGAMDGSIPGTGGGLRGGGASSLTALGALPYGGDEFRTPWGPVAPPLAGSATQSNSASGDMAMDDGTPRQPRRVGSAPSLPKSKPPRRFPCPDCAEAFTRKNDLFRHRRKHTGEKPFVCQGCGTAFARKDKLLLHSQRTEQCNTIRGPSRSEQRGRGPLVD